LAICDFDEYTGMSVSDVAKATVRLMDGAVGSADAGQGVVERVFLGGRGGVMDVSGEAREGSVGGGATGNGMQLGDDFGADKS
jgi:hypothetical protein